MTLWRSKPQAHRWVHTIIIIILLFYTRLIFATLLFRTCWLFRDSTNNIIMVSINRVFTTYAQSTYEPRRRWNIYNINQNPENEILYFPNFLIITYLLDGYDGIRFMWRKSIDCILRRSRNNFLIKAFGYPINKRTKLVLYLSNSNELVS